MRSAGYEIFSSCSESAPPPISSSWLRCALFTYVYGTAVLSSHSSKICTPLWAITFQYSQQDTCVAPRNVTVLSTVPNIERVNIVCVYGFRRHISILWKLRIDSTRVPLYHGNSVNDTNVRNLPGIASGTNSILTWTKYGMRLRKFHTLFNRLLNSYTMVEATITCPHWAYTDSYRI